MSVGPTKRRVRTMTPNDFFRMTSPTGASVDTVKSVTKSNGDLHAPPAMSPLLRFPVPCGTQRCGLLHVRQRPAYPVPHARRDQQKHAHPTLAQRTPPLTGCGLRRALLGRQHRRDVAAPALPPAREPAADLPREPGAVAASAVICAQARAVREAAPRRRPAVEAVEAELRRPGVRARLADL